MPNYLIIGGNSGIAHALIEELLESGAQVHAALRSVDSLDLPLASKQEYDATSPRELTLPESLDGLVYCPGTIVLKPFHRFKQEDYLADMKVNFFGAVDVLNQARMALRKSGAGSVVLFSSVAVQTGMPFHASIAAAKGALEGLARSLAAEWAPHVRVNLIAPSLHDTPLASSLLSNEKSREASQQRHPLKSIGTAQQCASLAHFLLSPQAAFISGQTLRPDGGLSNLR